MNFKRSMTILSLSFFVASCGEEQKGALGSSGPTPSTPERTVNPEKPAEETPTPELPSQETLTQEPDLQFKGASPEELSGKWRSERKNVGVMAKSVAYLTFAKDYVHVAHYCTFPDGRMASAEVRCSIEYKDGEVKFLEDKKASGSTQQIVDPSYCLVKCMKNERMQFSPNGDELVVKGYFLKRDESLLFQKQ